MAEPTDPRPADDSPKGGRSPARRRRSCLLRGGALLMLVVTAAVGGYWWFATHVPSISEEKVQQTIVATIRQERPSSFYVTGQLRTTVTSTITNTKVFLPDVLDWDVGTTKTSVRVPGTIYYGFEAGRLQVRDIRVTGDTITVTLPPLRVHSTEPDLSRMEVETSSGWTRFYDDSRTRTRSAALRRVQKAFRQQGEEHLRSSTQPRVNTAKALEKMLTPALEAAGYQDPALRFRLGDHLVMQPEG